MRVILAGPVPTPEKSWVAVKLVACLGASIAVLASCGLSPDDEALFEGLDGQTSSGTVAGLGSTNSTSVSAAGGAASSSAGTAGGSGGVAGQGSGGAGADGGVEGSGGSDSGGSDSGGSDSGGSDGMGGSPASGGTSGTGGVGGVGGVQVGSGGVGGSGGTEMTSGSGGAAGGAGEHAGGGAAGWHGSGGQSSCEELTFTPRATTAYVLVDRSSSMSEEGFWEPVRDALIASALALEDRVRFGLSAFTGQDGLTCPLELDSTDSVRLFNAEAMAELLDVLEPPDPLGVKGETPTARAVAAVRAALASEPRPGETYLLLITDGNPDFCDDGDADCAADALVYELQQASKLGIEARLFHLAGGAASPARLGNFARAGRGLAAVGSSAAIYTDCESEAEWLSLWSTLERTEGQALGAYRLSAPSGSYVTLDASDPIALEATFGSEVADLVSCHIDLAHGELDAEQVERVRLELGAAVLDFGVPDGWRLNNGSEIEITGAACAQYRSLDAPELRISVDCEGFDEP